MGNESPDEQDMSMDIRAMLGAIWARKLRIVLVTVLLLAGTYALLLFIPKSYESGAAVLVEPRDNAYTRATGEVPTSSGASDDIVVSSQIELIKSRDTLMKVVDSENLRSVPEFNGTASSPLGFLTSLFARKAGDKSVDEIVLNTLEDHLTVIRQRDSRIISILVTSTDPELAARLANAIAKAHVARRAELSNSDTAEASVWLEQEIEKLRTSVSEAEGKVADFRVKNDLYTSSATSGATLLDQQLSALSAQISAAQERQSTAESKATLISGLLAAGQPVEGVPDVRDSVVIQRLSEQKAQLTSERAQKLATLLANHPSVKALSAQIAEVDNQIAIEGKRVADALAAQAKIEAALVAKLQVDMTALKANASTATKEGVTLAELEREAKAQRDLLENYLARYRDAASRSGANAELPDVRVVTEATPSLVPSSPKTMLILIAVGAVSLVLQIGSILFGELLSGRALVERRREDAVEPTLMPMAVVESEPEPADEPVAVFVEPEAVSEPILDPEPAEEPALPDPIVPEAAAPAEETPREMIATILAEAPDEAIVAETDAIVSGMVEDRAEVDRFAVPPSEDAGDVSTLPDVDALASLSAEIGLRRVRVVMLAGIDSHADCVAVADTLTLDAMHLGLSIVRIDAGSGRLSAEPGVSDLSQETASFGDVVHKAQREGLAEVPWGQVPAIDRQSARPATLAEALADIYEVVIVMTGKVGANSSLPLFGGIAAPLVLVGHDIDQGMIAAAETDAQALGFGPVLAVEPPRKAAVA